MSLTFCNLAASLNSLELGIAYLSPIKTSENLKVFLYFQGIWTNKQHRAAMG